MPSPALHESFNRFALFETPLRVPVTRKDGLVYVRDSSFQFFLSPPSRLIPSITAAVRPPPISSKSQGGGREGQEHRRDTPVGASAERS